MLRRFRQRYYNTLWLAIPQHVKRKNIMNDVHLNILVSGWKWIACNENTRAEQNRHAFEFHVTTNQNSIFFFFISAALFIAEDESKTEMILFNGKVHVHCNQMVKVSPKELFWQFLLPYMSERETQNNNTGRCAGVHNIHAYHTYIARSWRQRVIHSLWSHVG